MRLFLQDIKIWVGDSTNVYDCMCISGCMYIYLGIYVCVCGEFTAKNRQL